MARLQAFDLRKEYPGNVALQGLNLTLHEGEVFCLLGQNGAGKTTTLNLLLGFVAPTTGRAEINGVPVRLHAPDTHRLVAYIPEVVLLYGELTGLENLRYFSRLAGERRVRASRAATARACAGSGEGNSNTVGTRPSGNASGIQVLLNSAEHTGRRPARSVTGGSRPGAVGARAMGAGPGSARLLSTG